MPPYGQIVPSGSYNNTGTDYISPKTPGGNIAVAASVDGSNVYAEFDSTNHAIKIDKINEETAAAGITVDSVLLKDGGVRLANAVYLTARNAANSADVNILRLNASNVMELNFNVPLANGGTGGTDASTARSNLGLTSLATQAPSSVTITGGTISGITDLAVADGGTGASTAATAASNLGLGTADTPTFAGARGQSFMSQNGGGTLRLGTLGNNAVQFTVNNTDVLTLNTAATLAPNSNNTGQIGDVSNRFNYGYLNSLNLNNFITGLVGEIWTPTITPQNGTCTGLTTYVAKFTSYGNQINIQLYFEFTGTGMSAAYIDVVMPYAAGSSKQYIYGVDNYGASLRAETTSGSTTFRVYRPTANFGNAAFGVGLNGFYFN